MKQRFEEFRGWVSYILQVIGVIMLFLIAVPFLVQFIDWVIVETWAMKVVDLYFSYVNWVWDNVFS